MAEPTPSDGPEEIERQQLFRLAMQGKWKEVISHCKMYPDLQDKPLTRAEDTTLHVAISAGGEGWVKQLLDVFKEETKGKEGGMKGILSKKNDGGSTPMHLAAALGMERACLEMALLCPDLVTTVRNKNGETPLFTAVRHGKKEAFFALERSLHKNVASEAKEEKEKRDLTHCRRDKDGNNILHCAIFGEYFGIIIEPLETKFDKYKCPKKDQPGEHASDNPNLPETWDIISQIYTFIKPVFATIIPKQIREKQAKNDEENPVSAESQQESSKGLKSTQTLENKKRKHNHAYQLMNELVQSSRAWEYEKKDGMDPHSSSGSHTSPSKAPDVETSTYSLAPPKELPPDDSSSSNATIAKPILVAAKNGIIEMVEKILNTFPVAVLDQLDKDKKNIILLAVEYRQSHIYAFMNKRKIMRDSVFGRVDKDGNSALHLAAKLSPQKLPWDLGGAAFRMQWDVKWYKYVMHSMEPQFFTTWNSKGETAQQIFSEDHKDLLKDAGKWMQETSQSFSVVATLIAGVAFASATTVPGGTNQDSGLPILSGVFSFKVFTVFALVAFCFSVASLLMFLNIITSPYRDEDFERSLLGKLLIGLTSLLTAIVAMLVAFCAGNFLAMEKELQSVAFAIYAITSFLVLIFALAQFPLYASLLEATVYTLPPKSAEIMDTF